MGCDWPRSQKSDSDSSTHGGCDSFTVLAASCSLHDGGSSQ
uniref:Uncharacterized protein n=1 Tax=Rhizophora mucronata TaxID=61149 RepID=A0A2P2NTR1_RHIMU